MRWAKWMKERGSEPPVYSPVVSSEHGPTVLWTILSRRLPRDAVVVGEFARIAGQLRIEKYPVPRHIEDPA